MFLDSDFPELRGVPFNGGKWAAVIAFKKGYTVSWEGDVIAPSGKARKTIFYRSEGEKVSGYLKFNIFHAGRCISVKVHQLCAYQKFGNALLASGVVTRHKNGDFLDNSWPNILIGTQSENMMDCTPAERQAKAVMAAGFVRRFSDTVIQAIQADRKSGMTYAEIGRKYSISKSSLSYLLNKSRQAKHVAARV